MTWTPLLFITTALLLVAGLVRLLDGRPGPLPMLAVATLAAITLDATHDPAERLLAPTPVSAFARQLLRVGLVVAPATVCLVAVTALLPGESGRLFAPGLALTLSGLAVATWLPPDRDVRIAAALPVMWVLVQLVLGGHFGVAGDVAGWWHSEPLAVCAAAVLCIVLGSRR